jgi:hypothetical protein
MTPEQLNLMRVAARNLLHHEEVGRKCDPHALPWARWVIRQDWPECGMEPPYKIAPARDDHTERHP